MLKLLLGLIFLVSLLIVLYLLKKKNNEYVMILKGPKKFNTGKKIIIPFVENIDNKSSFTLEFQAKTQNLPLSLVGRDYMNVIAQGDSFNVMYDPENGAYLVKIYHSNKKKNGVSMLKLKNVPNQTWNKIKVIVQGRKVMIFLNNTLQVAKILPGIPLLKDRDFELSSDINSFKGSLKNVKYNIS